MPQGTKTAEKPASERLESWKEIASYLRCGERTAKRWEKTRKLPVLRLPGVRGQVFAFRSDIAEWRMSNLSPPGILEEPNAVEDDSEGSTHVAPERSDASPLPGEGLVAGRRAPLWRILVPLAAMMAAVTMLSVLSLRAHSHAAVSTATAAHVAPQRARDLYLTGRFYLNKRTPADLQQALEDFQAALAVDHAYAAPYAGLADAYGLSTEFATMDVVPSQVYPLMLEAARHSIALDPNLAEGHRALGFVLYYWNWDLPGARREFDRSIALNDHDATTFLWYANVLQEAGDYGNALVIMDRARELDPTSPPIMADRGLILRGLNRGNEAARAWIELENTDAAFLPPHWYRAAAALDSGDGAQYLAELKNIAGITRAAYATEHFEMCTAGYKSSGIGGLRKAEAAFRVKQTQHGGFGNYFVTGEALAAISHNDEALHYLDLAFRSRDSIFPALAHDDKFYGLENDPRFQDLKARSLVPYPDSAALTSTQH